ncbi:MAG: T9SS type A sorting domain-containing protein [Bacteroidota bacterium]
MNKRIKIITVFVLVFNFVNAQNYDVAPMQPTSADMAFDGEQDYFPLGVWMQQTSKVEDYKAIGINNYTALWEGLTAQKEADLKAAGMPLIVDPVGYIHSTGETNDYALTLSEEDRKFIKAWLSPTDEPDNPKKNPETGKYDIYVSPDSTYAMYEHIKEITNDGKPVYLGIGRGVSDINWVGRGANTGKWEMYAEETYGYVTESGSWINDESTPAIGFCKGGDIVHYDIYPANYMDRKLEWVPKGVDSLVSWSKPGKPIFVAIEASQIKDEYGEPTPSEIRTEIWMSIIHGARGVVYFSHSWVGGTTNEDALLDNTEIANGIKDINAEITSLASVINSPNESFVQAKLVYNPDFYGTIDYVCKSFEDDHYVFAVEMSNKKKKVEFFVPSGVTSVEVINEDRTIEVVDGKFKDTFEAYDTHLYKLLPSGVNLSENDKVIERNIEIYPNPTTGQVYVGEDTSDNVNKIEVYSMQGQLIKVVSNQDNIDLSFARNQMLLLKIYSNKGVKTAKVSVK